MPRYIALLRAINVGGHSRIKMPVLRRAFEDLGFSNVSTFIASGNVFFEARITSSQGLERRIEKGLAALFGRPVTTFVRTAAEITRIATRTPYRAADLKGADVNILFLGRKPGAAALRNLKALKSRTDEFQAQGREIHWLRRRLPGRPDYTSIPLDKALKMPFTVRGLRTVQKMAAKYGPDKTSVRRDRRAEKRAD